MVDREGTRVRWLQRGAHRLDGDTLFEIGSISKVFAALLVADAEQRGELALDDDLQRYLPTWKLPTRNGRKMTLRHALTHTLGMEEWMPTNWVATDAERGQSRYTEAMFRDCLAGYALKHTPGEKYAYTNLGSALIGLVLSQRTGQTYSTLLRDRIFRPLAMRDSGFADVRPDPQASVLPGYEEDETPSIARVDLSPLAPCCVVRSTLNDMGRFIAAAVDDSSALAAAFARIAELQMEIEPELPNQRRVALGWDVDTARGVLRKNGQVAGYRSDLLISRSRQRGLYVIVNSMRSNITSLANGLFALLHATRAASAD